MALFDTLTVPADGNNVFTTTVYPAINQFVYWQDKGGRPKTWQERLWETVAKIIDKSNILKNQC